VGGGGLEGGEFGELEEGIEDERSEFRDRKEGDLWNWKGHFWS
jgi:hypothetical protein